MPPVPSPWLLPALALLRKDALAEQRQRTALNASLLFAVTALMAVAFSLGALPAPPKVLAAVLWVVIFFAAMAGLARSFVAEEESGTALALRLSGGSAAVLLGKLLANLALLAILEVVVLPLFLLLLRLPISDWLGFAAVLTLGTLGLAGAATVAAALVARASGRGELFAVLAFPLLFPGLIGAISGTQACLPSAVAGPGNALLLLAGFDGMLLTVAFLVFDYAWEE